MSPEHSLWLSVDRHFHRIGGKIRIATATKIQIEMTAQEQIAIGIFFRLQMETLDLQGPHRDMLAPASLRVLMEGRGINIGNWFMDLA